MTMEARSALTTEDFPDENEEGILSTAYPLLSAMWLPVCLLIVCAYIYAIIGRFAYPYPLEWLEPATSDIVSRILSGLPIYGEPTYSYVPSMKASLYYYVVATVAPAIGNSLYAGRLVSILASFGICSVIWIFVRREGGTWTWSLFGIALFLAAYHLSLDWYDIARLDSLFLLITIVGAFALRFARRPAIAGLAFAAAFFTKQAVLFVIVPMFLLYAFAEPRRVIIASSIAAILIVAGVAGLHFVTSGWSTYFLFEVPRHAALRLDQIARLFTADILVPFFLALLSSIGLIAKTWKSGRERALFYGGFLSGTVLVGLVGRANVAGSPNVFMPAYAVLAVTMPLGLRVILTAWSERKGLKLASGVAVHLAALVQLATLLYDPRHVVPSPHDTEVSDQVLAHLRSIDHRMLIMDDRYFAGLLGNGSIGLDYSLTDVLEDRNSAVAAKLQESIIGALRTGQFSAVVDPPAFILEQLELSAPVILQSTPFDQSNRFTPRLRAYYSIAN
jgi:hypothetical protein